MGGTYSTSEQMLNWYKTQVICSTNLSEEAYRIGEYDKAQYYLKESSNYAKRVKEIESSILNN